MGCERDMRGWGSSSGCGPPFLRPSNHLVDVEQCQGGRMCPPCAPKRIAHALWQASQALRAAATLHRTDRHQHNARCTDRIAPNEAPDQRSVHLLHRHVDHRSISYTNHERGWSGYFSEFVMMPHESGVRNLGPCRNQPTNRKEACSS